jgi:hypothetical protein
MISSVKNIYNRFRALSHYTIIAGAGFLIDTVLFLVFTHFNVLPVFWASVIGIIAGASFVFAFATRMIFVTKTGFQWHKWTIFMGYILLTLFVWSGVIASLVVFGLWPLLAKMAILPISFYGNFLFMGWLQEGRLRWH